METVQECFGWAGTGITVLSFLFPVFPYINVLKGKLDFESTPAVLVTTCYVNYFCWYIYGDMIFSDQIKYCYMIGGIVNLILMIIYLAYEVKRYLVDSILNTLILITGTWALYRALTIIIDDDRIVGKICIGTSFIVFLSPIQIIYKVIKEKNYILIPIYNCYLIFLYSICWVVYGIFITDFYVVFPNAIAIVLALVEIIIYLNYKRKYPGIGEREFSSTIGIETTANEEANKKEDSSSIKMEEVDDKVKEKPVKIITKN
jgi:uncharacterized protein with PQ loop repeat